MSTCVSPSDLTKKLAAFAQWALHDGVWVGFDLDGSDIQDKAVELGLLVAVPYNPEVHGPNDFDAESGDDWLIWSDEMKSLLERAKQEHGSEPEVDEAG